MEVSQRWWDGNGIGRSLMRAAGFGTRSLRDRIGHIMGNTYPAAAFLHCRRISPHAQFLRSFHKSRA
jgi:hypothetical protein